jgi:5-methylcytosine-specific restriction endonuclease McrA
MCSKHYQRLKRTGSLESSIPENFDRSKYKYCSSCKKVLEKNLYGKDSKNKDGLRWRCKKCAINLVSSWQKRNPDKKKKYNQNYKKNNKTKVNEINSRRRATRKNAQAFMISKKDFRKLKNDCCFSCGAKTELSLDHIIPLKRGGTHGIGNLQILCISCNCSKQDMLFAEWRYKNAKE